jgi:hypothetical protein
VPSKILLHPRASVSWWPLWGFGELCVNAGVRKNAVTPSFLQTHIQVQTT